MRNSKASCAFLLHAEGSVSDVLRRFVITDRYLRGRVQSPKFVADFAAALLQESWASALKELDVEFPEPPPKGLIGKPRERLVEILNHAAAIPLYLLALRHAKRHCGPNARVVNCNPSVTSRGLADIEVMSPSLVHLYEVGHNVGIGGQKKRTKDERRLLQGANIITSEPRFRDRMPKVALFRVDSKGIHPVPSPSF